MASIIAFDIDLRRLHAYSTKYERVAYNYPEWDESLKAKALEHDVILAECWSPQMYFDIGKKSAKAELTNRLRAAIFNSMIIGQMIRDLGDKLLIAPSSAWTCKYPEKIRHEMSGITGKMNHDLRECFSMIDFYRRVPQNWKLPHLYLKDI
jgi:hypothetical protein